MSTNFKKFSYQNPELFR